MKIVKQPRGTNLCGQSCVAMVAGINLVDAVLAFDGYQGKTRTKHLIDAFKVLGIRTDERLSVAPKKDKSRWGCKIVMIVHYVDKINKIRHWMVCDHGTILDPAGRHTGKRLDDPSICEHIKSSLGIREGSITNV